MTRVSRLLALIAIVVSASAAFAQVVEPNVNMVAGTDPVTGDPYLQRQNEASIAISTRRPLTMLALSNDYRAVDIPFDEGTRPDGEDTGDAWIGVFQSRDGGRTWRSNLLEGYPQQTFSNSPLHGYQAAADPVVRAANHGLFFATGIVLNRDVNPLSGVWVARFIDDNNTESGDPVTPLGVTMIDKGTSGQFIDKPWLAVAPQTNGTQCTVDGQTFTGQNVYVAYTVFVGGDNNIRTKLMFARSTDCGATWSAPTKLSEGFPINQGATIAVSPTDGAVYVLWRRFKTNTDSDALMLVKSTDQGQTFTKGAVVTTITPFEQPTSSAEIRTNAYPSATVDSTGRLYVVWAQRSGPAGYGATGNDGRILLMNSTDGTLWSPAVQIDSYPYNGHQFQPTILATGNKLTVAYYDLRDDSTLGRLASDGTESRIPKGDLALAPAQPQWVFTTLLQDQSHHRRHTLDVRAAQASTGTMPVFTSVRVSRYLFGTLPGVLPKTVDQLQVNPPNFPLFRQGTAPFIGDYIDIAGYAGSASVQHVVWTDNRDVRPPLDGDWTHYTPVGLATKRTSTFNGTAVPDCIGGQAGMRNQNIYTTRLTEGLFAGAASTFRQLSIQRAFSVFVQNAKKQPQTYHLVISAPGGTVASFFQDHVETTLDISVTGRSMATRSVFVSPNPANPRASVNVSITETGVASPLTSTVVLNPDLSNPDLSNPDLSNSELHNPDLSNPDLSNPDLSNPDLSNPDLSNPDLSNPDLSNSDITNPDLSNPDLSNPDLSNPDLSNPDLSNPDLSNGAISDTTWTAKNNGTATSGYNVKLVSNGPPNNNFKTQLIINRLYQTPIANGCKPGFDTQRQIMANIPNPRFSDGGDLLDPLAKDREGTYWLAPGDTIRITLRVYDPNKFDNITFNPTTDVAAVTVSQAANVVNGVVQTTPTLASSLPIITTTSIDDAVSGRDYTTTFVATGGKTPYTWSATPGSIDNSGVYTNVFQTSEIPPQITVTVTDAANHSMTKSFLVAVYQPLVINTTSIPPATLNQPYSAILAATGGKTPYTWHLYKPPTPPAGLSLNPATGEISGTPTAPFTGDLIFQVTDAATPNQTSPVAPMYFSASSPPGGCSNTLTKLFDNSNIFGVSNGGTSPTFTTPNGQTYCLDSVWTYHWNGGQGQTPGTIELTTNCAASCTILGPWQAVGSAGQGGAQNVNWTATPPAGSPVLLNGTYNVVDSDGGPNGTWSQNATSGGKGFSIVYGRAYTPPLHAALIHLTYNGQPLTPSVQPQMFVINLDTNVFLPSSQIVWNGDDTVTVSGLPDAHYNMEVAIPANAQTPKYFPGGFWQQQAFLIAGGDANVNMAESRLIHLTQPADNANYLGTAGAGCQPPSLTVAAPASIAWDNVDPNVTNVTYRYSILLVDCATGSRTPVASGQTSSLSADLTQFTFAPTTSTQFYQLTLFADSPAQTEVGQIMVVGDNYNFYGWALNFTVPDAGNALAFDGVNDLVTVPDSPSLSLQNALTIEGWIKIDDPSGQHLPLLAKGADYGNYFLGVLGNPTPFPGGLDYVHQVATGNFSCCGPAGVVPFGTWTHIAATFTGGVAKVYANGNLIASGSGGGTPVVNNAALTLGKVAFTSVPSEFLKGQIDEVRIWNVARSDTDIAQNYNKHVDPLTAGLVAYWKFDEAGGTAVNDATSNANNGSLGGAPSNGTDQPQRVRSAAPIRP